MIDAFIFDMDGILTDTDRTRFELLKDILKDRHLTLYDSEYKKTIGKKTVVLLNELFGDLLTAEDILEISKKRKEILHKRPKDFIKALPFAVDCVEMLSKYRLALASSTDRKEIDLVLDTIGLKKYFNVIVSGDMVLNQKPFPDPYLKASELLKIDKSKCVAIEDSPVGIESARRAGIFCIGVPYTHSKFEISKADIIFENLKEIYQKYGK